MGDYASASDVEDRLSTYQIDAFDGSSDPTLTTVNEWIAQYEGDINAILIGLNYSTVPATGSHDVVRLRRYVAERTAAEVFMHTWDGQQIPPRVQTWLDSWKQFLTALTDSKWRLQDQDPAGTAARRMVIGGMRQTSTTWTDTDIETFE